MKRENNTETMKDLSELIDRLIAQRDEAREELSIVRADRDSIKRDWLDADGSKMKQELEDQRNRTANLIHSKNEHIARLNADNEACNKAAQVLAEKCNELEKVHDTLRGTISLMTADRDRCCKACRDCKAKLERLESPWIPMSTPPTEADGDTKSEVLHGWSGGHITKGRWNSSYSDSATHWMRIPPLPAPKPVKPDPLACLRAIVEFCDDPQGQGDNPQGGSESLAMGLARLLPAAREAITERTTP